MKRKTKMSMEVLDLQDHPLPFSMKVRVHRLRHRANTQNDADKLGESQVEGRRLHHRDTRYNRLGISRSGALDCACNEVERQAGHGRLQRYGSGTPAFRSAATTPKRPLSSCRWRRWERRVNIPGHSFPHSVGERADWKPEEDASLKDSADKC